MPARDMIADCFRYIETYLGVSGRRAALCLSVFASLERCLAIIFPLKSVSRRACAKPNVVILSVFMFVFVILLHFVFDYKVNED